MTNKKKEGRPQNLVPLATRSPDPTPRNRPDLQEEKEKVKAQEASPEPTHKNFLDLQEKKVKIKVTKTVPGPILGAPRGKPANTIKAVPYEPEDATKRDVKEAKVTADDEPSKAKVKVV